MAEKILVVDDEAKCNLQQYLRRRQSLFESRFFEAYRIEYFSYFTGQSIRSLITSPAINNPATEGTNDMLPGICRRALHLRVDSVGQIQFA